MRDKKAADIAPQPPTTETIRAARETREKAAHYNAMLTCLRCSTVNKPHATVCSICGANLVVPDEMHHTKSLGSARSSVGQVRNNNEDNVGLWARDGVLLALAADGMGGAAAGEEASRLVKEAVQANFMGAARGSETLQELSEVEIFAKLRLSIRHANDAILEKIREDPRLQGMGTTTTVGIVRGNRLLIAHIGDSRAYLVNGETGWIHRVTDDHSFVEALIASGHITKAQAAVHPMRSVLYRALGQSDELSHADLYARFVKPGDRIILCSDGLPRHIDDSEIAQIAMQYDDPEAISQKLIELTNERGAEDNVSAVVLLIEASDEQDPLEQLKPVPSEHEVKVKKEDDAYQTGRVMKSLVQELRDTYRKKPQDDNGDEDTESP
jgi:protein phosphatase